MAAKKKARPKAAPKNGIGKRFAKGNPGGGRPPIPEHLRGVKDVTPEIFRKTINKYMHLTLGELKAQIENPEDVPMKDLLILEFIKYAYEKKDPTRLEFMYNRWLGKVKESFEIDLNLSAIPDRELLQLGSEAMKMLKSSTEDVVEGEIVGDH